MMGLFGLLAYYQLKVFTPLGWLCLQHQRWLFHSWSLQVSHCMAFLHLLQSFFTSLGRNDFASTSFLTLVHSSLLSHPFCPNLPLESPGSISIHICVELIWGLDHCTPSFLPRPLPHYSSTCEIKLPHVEGGGDNVTGWERRGQMQDGAAEGSHSQVLATVCLSGSCQLQLASWYITQVSFCCAFSALPPSSLSASSPALTSALYRPYSNWFLLCLLLLISKLSIWSFILSFCTLSDHPLKLNAPRKLKVRRQHPLSRHPSEKQFFMEEEISFSNRQTCFISLNNRIWVPIWQLIRLIRARAHLRGTDADGAKLETMLEWTRSRGVRGGRVGS